jgi:hypothetical protein
MEGAMRRAGITLLVVCAVLAVGSAAGGLARAASKTVSERFEPLQAQETPTPSYFVYLPLVVRESGVGGWTTVVEEGFETDPGNLWDFWNFGGYQWARSTCRPYTGDYSAWAVGGGTYGSSLACGSNYPNNVDSWMSYGPFSLKDATAAALSFQLWMHVDPAIYDYLCIFAKSVEDDPWENGVCLTYQPTDWSPVTIRLDDDLLGINMLGVETVWIALYFTSDDEITYPEGVYVDDIVVRQCTGGLCQSAAGAGAQLSPAQMRKVGPGETGDERRTPAEQRLPR